MFNFKKAGILALTVASTVLSAQNALACADPGVQLVENGGNPFSTELRVFYNGFKLGNQTFYFDHKNNCWGSYAVGGRTLRCLGSEALNINGSDATLSIKGKKATLSSRGFRPLEVTLTASKTTSGRSEWHAIEAELDGKSLLVRNDVNAPQPRSVPGAPSLSEVADLGKRSYRKTGTCGTRLERVSLDIGVGGGGAIEAPASHVRMAD